MEAAWKTIAGGVTAPTGYRAAAVTAGIKRKRPDLALIVSDTEAALAGVFTTNRVAAAPVVVCRECVAGGQARAVIANSGVANAATGEKGLADAYRMAELTAATLGCRPQHVCVSSTGTIGLFLPMDKIEAGIREAAAALSETGGEAAARAIMTTDTVPKTAAVELCVEGATVRIGAMSKGAGMIEPNMATMLAYVTTDARVAAGDLQACLEAAVAGSFNRITVDGDMSTNDTALFLANGASGVTLAPGRPGWDVFKAATADVAHQLALMMVADGEGATKVVTVTVTGAVDARDAARVARAIANSLLVKTSWYGCDPNWGRVLAAVGYSGAAIDPAAVDIAYDGVPAACGGMAAGTPLDQLEAVIRQAAFTLTVDLHQGNGSDTVYASDCSEEYVRINSAYMT